MAPGMMRAMPQAPEFTPNPTVPPAAASAALSDPLLASSFVRRGTLPITLLVQAAVSGAVLAPTVAAPRLMSALQVGTAAVGFYIALVYLAAMFSSQWGAALVRRWGPIRSSQFALVCCGLGLLLVGVPQIGAAAAGAVLLGIGYGPVTPASSEMLARTTPPERYALVFSVKQTGVPLGGALAGMCVPGLIVLGGVAGAMGAMALLCAAGLLLAQPLRATLDAARNPQAPLPSARGMAQPVRLVLGHGALRRVAMCSLVLSVVQVSVTSYLVSFLTGDLAWTLVAAGAASSLAQGGGVVGRILWGWVADRWGGASRTLTGLMVLMLACGLAMATLGPHTSAGWVLVLLVAYGASAIGWNGVYLATVARLVPKEQAAAATAGSLFFTYLGVVVGPPAFGLVGGYAGSLGVAFAALSLPLVVGLVLLARAPREASKPG